MADRAAGEGPTGINSLENQIDTRAEDDLMEQWKIECSREQVVAETGGNQRECMVTRDIQLLETGCLVQEQVDR